MPASLRPLAVSLLLVSLTGCECSEESGCLTRDDCPPGWACLDGMCVEPPDAGGEDAATPPPRDAGVPDAGCDGPVCGGACCEVGERCFMEACVPDLGACEANDDCVSDSYCAADGTCVPYGTPPERERNEECVQDIDIEAITPAVQCAWTEPPAGDPHPESDDLRGTPVVVDFDFDEDPSTLQPSIVFSSFGGSGGEVLRVIDGATCEQQHVVATGITSATTPALGDLDGDGRAEIVVNVSGVATAYAYDPASGGFVERWTGATCDGAGGRTPHTGFGSQGYSASLHDLDDDGRPEVIGGGSVYDADGCLVASLGTTELDRLPVVADVDEDGEPEIVASTGVYRLDPSGPSLVAEDYFAGTTSGGSFPFAAVGDLGDFPLDAFGGADRAEIVVVGDGAVRVETLEGTRLLSGTLPSGRGGPPTIADFDGDGRAEFAAAAREEYVVFDLDCLAGGDPAGCGGMARTDGRLWSLAVDEQSSGVTGSSVFDFDADGRAEVIYHDECYLRVFSGTDGEVLYSFPRSSLTWFEMPVVADVDGDFHSEIVVGAHDYDGSCPSPDPYRSGITFMRTHGVYVLRDELDRWAASRPIWNQHAYSVTHVGDRGEIPRTSDVDINWRTPELNNFRQNTQGDLEALGVADLTSSVRGVTPLECRDGMATVNARVCNRGRLPLGGGLEVALTEGAVDGPELCRTTIAAPIDTGECVEISCTATAPDEAVDLYVVPDPDDVVDECHESNSWGRLENVACVLI
ncbi:MAG TPA: VCBS repeat-containing protein [Sandaracinaceae bacterium LLY-WYZ-13_1]|nr:VCBS repeat-containing protein [Sandaracinaceae bacterium LLY-WYZ-13_1]